LTHYKSNNLQCCFDLETTSKENGKALIMLQRHTHAFKSSAISIILLLLGVVGGTHAQSDSSAHLTLLSESVLGLHLRVDLDPGTVAVDTSLLVALPPKASVLLQTSHPELVGLSEPIIWMGQRFVALDFFFQSENGQTASFEVELTFAGNQGANPGRAEAVLSAETAKQLGSKVVNKAILFDRVENSRDHMEPLARYLVVAYDDALEYMGDWVRWKQQQGYDVELVSSTSIGATEMNWQAIRNATSERYFDGGLDYLLIVGDMSLTEAGWHVPSALKPGGPYAEWQWGLQIVTDHPLVLLEGDDYFADVHVGRLAVNNPTQLVTALNRIQMYEQATLLPSYEWLEKGYMVYDVSEADSRRETSFEIREMLLDAGYTQVDTLNNNRVTNPQSPMLVVNKLNEGAGVVNYRGYGYRNSWNGPLFNSDHIMEDLTNMGKWPLVTSIVCGGGDFGTSSYSPCLGEAFTRAGSPSAPFGAIAFIGPSEEDTHTRWNNTLSVGIYQGLAREGAHAAGALNARGKLEVWLQFPADRNEDWQAPGSSSQAQNVPFYFHCYNLLGDPGVKVRTQRPLILHADLHDEVTSGLRLGTTGLTLQLRDASGYGLSGVTATLMQDSLMQDTALVAQALSGDQGDLFMEFETLQAGDYTLTLSGVNVAVMQTVCSVTPQDQGLEFTQARLLGDSEAMALMNGETRELELRFEAFGSNDSEAYRLRLSCLEADLMRFGHSDEGSVLLDLPLVQAGDSLWLSGVSLLGGRALTQGAQLSLMMQLEDLEGGLLWQRPLHFRGVGPEPLLLDTETLSGDWQGGSTVEFRLQLGLDSDLEIELARVKCYPLSESMLMIADETVGFSLLPQVEGWTDDFELQLDADLLASQPLPCELVFFAENGATLARMPFHLPRPESLATDPLGPCDGGYIVYHSDDDAPEAPAFVWQDLSELGDELDLQDSGSQGNSAGIDGASTVVQLPFDFGFYGQSYHEITVCSNGWLAMGDQSWHVIGLNTAIPAAQGPNAMVAVLWADLYNYYSGDQFGHVFVYADPDRHSFRVQWASHDYTGYPFQSNWFECELRDPAFWPTETGEGEILMHYEDITLNTSENSFTVGLEQASQMAGLQVVFAGQYEMASQIIDDGVSLRFIPGFSYNESELMEPSRPVSLGLFEAYPNPFNPSTRIRFTLAQAAKMQWQLYDLRGALVRSQTLGQVAAGEQEFSLDASALASGSYFLHLSGESASLSFQRTLRLVLMK
jgi:hypothetical protein